MNDKELLLAFVAQAGITRSDEPESEAVRKSRCIANRSGPNVAVSIVRLGAHDSVPNGPKWSGYSGFFTEFLFNADGELVEYGCWE